MTGNLLFDMLTREAKRAIFASMEPLMVSAGTAIITQGDEDASTFYVLEIGNCDVFVCNESTGGQPLKVHSYTSGRCAALSSAFGQAGPVQSSAGCCHQLHSRSLLRRLGSTQRAVEQLPRTLV